MAIWLAISAIALFATMTLSLQPHIVGLILVLSIVSGLIRLLRGSSGASYDIPHVSTTFAPFGLPGAALPSTWWNPGILYTWNNRFTLWKGKSSSSLCLDPLIWGEPTLFTKSVEIMKQITANKSSFDKTPMGVQGQSLFGASNVVTSFQEGWPRHRRILNPALNTSVYERVWEQSRITYDDMVDSEGWSRTESLVIPDIIPLTKKFTLLILTAAGFGLPLPWEEKKTGSEMSLAEAYELMSQNLTLSLAVPSWAEGLPLQVLKNMKESKGMIIAYMKSIIEMRRVDRANSTDMEDTADLFGALLKANEAETGKAVLNDNEVMSNMYILLFAGHDTSAKTMAVALGLLACNPEKQEALYSQVAAFFRSNKDLTISAFEDLRPVQYCIVETLRLFPTAPLLIRHPLETTTLHPEDGKPFVVNKGTTIICDIIGINYDAKNFPNPTEFEPSRWEGKSELSSGDFMSFGAGPRACLGRKFAMLEMTCFVALILRDWKVEPILEAGEDLKGWRKRVLDDDVTLTITLGPSKVPLKLTRRDSVSRFSSA